MRIGRSFVMWIGIVVALLAPARVWAQDASVSHPAAENYRIEGLVRYWSPSARALVSSDAPDVPGTRIDFKSDLGLTDRAFPDFQLVFHPALRHKFRVQYVPIRFDSTGSPPRDLIFNGDTYRAHLPITSRLDWKTYRFGYEYDFVARRWGFVGLIAEVKHTIVEAHLESAAAAGDSRQAMPVPALGGIVRVYPTPRLSLTGETTYFAVPDRPDGHYGGSILDIDAYATWSFSRRFGAQAGFRDIDIHHLGEWNTATFTLKGVHVGVVVRY